VFCIFKNIPLKPKTVVAALICVVFLTVLNFLKVSAAGLYINEILVSNSAYYVGSGTYADWIEIYNDGPVQINLSGYYLTDEKNNPVKWPIPDIVIPSKGYRVFYADNGNADLHTNFSLNLDGEFLGLYNSDGMVIDSFTFKRQRNNISFGRPADNPQILGYFEEPTPYASNTKTLYPSILKNPVFSSNGGFYISPTLLTLTSDPGSDIRYTTDGSEPTQSSNLYTGSINIDSTTCIRAVAFMDGYISSEVNSQTLFINVLKTLPVVSLSTDPTNFFGDSTGIYIIGTNGIRSGCSPTRMNLNQDWEQPVNIEIYDDQGIVKINQGAGVKIFGGCSRQRYPIKSLEVFARKQYGDGSFSAKLFENEDIHEFESFLLRSGSDDQQSTMFRDALGHTLVSDLKAESQAYQPVVVFINGRYWGIHNLREKYSEAYFEEHFGVSADGLNVIDNNAANSYNIRYGSAADYLGMMSYLRAHISDDDIYDAMNERMDIESHTDYMASQIYLAADDWPGNNIRYWKSDNGKFNKWRWAFYDMDHVVKSNNTRWNTILLATTPYNGDYWPNPPWSVELFNYMLSIDQFRYEFIQRICFLMNTSFSASNIIAVVDSLSSKIAPEMPCHIARWGGQLVDDPARESWINPLPSSMNEWEQHVQVMRQFAMDRPDTAINMLREYFRLSDTVRISIDCNDPASGYLYMGPKSIPHNSHTGIYFSDIPIVLQARSKPGYRFVRWEITPAGYATQHDESCRLSYEPTGNTYFRAIFEPYSIEGPIVIINEINYHSSDTADAGDWVELYNRVPDAVDISGWILKDDSDDHSFEIPENIVLPEKGYIVICEDTSEFINRFTDSGNRTGNFSFGFGNGGDCIRLYNQQMIFVDSVRYSDETPWPYLADGYGKTLSLVDPFLSNDLPINWSDKYLLTPGDTNVMKHPIIVSINTPVDENTQSNWLAQNYPNPCNEFTILRYGLKQAGNVSLIVSDLYGRVVLSPVNQRQTMGEYQIAVLVKGLDPGTYLYTLRVDNSVIKTRMMVVY
jgi:hypothetical protein